MPKRLEDIKGLLIDIAGTLEFKQQALPGTVEAYTALKNANIPMKLLTNTDSKDPRHYITYLQSLGFPVSLGDIYTPIVALYHFIQEHLEESFFILATAAVRSYLQDQFIDATPKLFFKETIADSIFKSPNHDQAFPTYTVVCDFNDDWNVKYLDLAFQFVSKGSKLLGSQGNRYYLDHQGDPRLDTGSFLTMLQSAANRPATILGKPTATYFQKAATEYNLPPSHIAVVGDDFETDIQGGHWARMKTIQVQTGKGHDSLNHSFSEITPDLIIPSFADLPSYLL